MGSRFLDSDRRNLVECALGVSGELLTIPLQVSEPSLGQIRFQWWRDLCSDRSGSGFARFPGSAVMLSPLLGAGHSAFVIQLINACEDAFLDGSGYYAAHSAMMRLLWRIVGDPENDGLMNSLGHLYAIPDKSGAERADGVVASLKSVADYLDQPAGDDWSLICAFTLITDWVSDCRASPIERRWRIWRSFLAGEKALARQCAKLAEELSQASTRF